MMFAIGIALFALAILVSVALHECGHMWVARATGMKVRRYFVGFGPTVWSTMRPNKLGHTEYGLKAVPLGGFCDIAGMTSVEELAPDEDAEDRGDEDQPEQRPGAIEQRPRRHAAPVACMTRSCSVRPAAGIGASSRPRRITAMRSHRPISSGR